MIGKREQTQNSSLTRGRAASRISIYIDVLGL